MGMHISGVATETQNMLQCVKQRMQRKLNLAVCLGPTYYLNCLFGLFPGRYDLLKYKSSDDSDVTNEAPFYTTRLAKCAGFGFWSCVTVAYAVVNCHREMKDFFDRLNFICVGITFIGIYNFCLLHSSDEIIGCFNAGYHLLQRRRYTDDNYFSEMFFIFLPVLIAILSETLVFYFQWKFEAPWLHSTMAVVSVAELCLFSCIMTLCLAAQIIFDDINKRLNSIKLTPVPKEINDLMCLHWRAGEFADSLSKCFGGIALLTACLNLIRFVMLFVKLGIWFATPGNVDIELARFSATQCVKIAWFFINICVRSQRMASKAVEAKCHLQKIMCRKTLSAETIELLYLFKMQTGLREICLTARGCFKYNMESVLTAGHVVVAYFVAFIQMK